MELFGPTLLRSFPLKKSDFFGIFKNVLTGFYCILIMVNIIKWYHKIFHHHLVNHQATLHIHNLYLSISLMAIVSSIYLIFYIAVGVGTFLLTLTPPKLVPIPTKQPWFLGYRYVNWFHEAVCSGGSQPVANLFYRLGHCFT
jgi:uncharacterized membrane protein